MTRPVRRLLALAALLGCAAPAQAQVLPGFNRADENPHLRRFRQEMFQEVSEVMTEWRQAWMAKDARGAARLFAEAGVLMLPERQKVQGRGAVGEELQAMFPQLGGLQYSIQDFTVGDGLAVATGRFWYETTVDGQAGPGSAGTYIAAFEREADRWRIRVMMLRDEKEPLS